MPNGTCVFGVGVNRTRNPPSDVTHGICRKSLAVWRLGHGRPIRRCRTGPPGCGRERPPCFDAQCGHRGGLGRTSPSHPPAGVAPGPAVPCGKAKRRAGTGPVPAAVGDAVQPTGQPVGQRVLRRFEAALDTFREGLLAASDPKGSEAEGVRKHTRPRTRTRPSDWWVASVTAQLPRAPRANGAVRPKDVPAPADGRERRCASLAARSAHRPLVSFPRSGTAPTGGASRFRACPPRPGFGGPRPRRCRCGQSRHPGPRLRGPPAGCLRRRPDRGRPPTLAEPLRWFSTLAGATLRVSPARLTRGSAPSTPDSSALPTGFADCRLSPGWTTHSPWLPCWAGSAVPMSRSGSESEVAAPVNPTRSWPSRKGSLVRERPLGGGGRACESTLVAKPHQALGAGGRSRHGPCGPSGNGRAGHRAAGRCAHGGCASAAV